MNKKYLMFGLPILAFGLVMAATLMYYGSVQQEIIVAPSITLSGACEDTIEAFGGDTVMGEECTITNNANTERTISITEDSDDNISVRYMSKLILSGKETANWTNIGNGTTIKYTVVGDDFIVDDIPEGMTLIYYPNTAGDDFATNVDNIKVLTNGVNENLPISIDVGDDYCGNGFNPTATQCIGAKLWLLPGVLDETQARAKVLAWNTAGFLFETALIQYSIDGTGIIMSGTTEGAGASSLTITPVYTIGAYVNGTYTIQTTIA